MLWTDFECSACFVCLHVLPALPVLLAVDAGQALHTYCACCACVVHLTCFALSVVCACILTHCMLCLSCTRPRRSWPAACTLGFVSQYTPYGYVSGLWLQLTACALCPVVATYCLFHAAYRGDKARCLRRIAFGLSPISNGKWRHTCTAYGRLSAEWNPWFMVSTVVQGDDLRTIPHCEQPLVRPVVYR